MATDYYPEQRSSHALTAFIMGAALGAVAALLLAPASGAETRSKVKKLSKDLSREAKRRFEQGRQRLQETVQEAEETLESEMGSGSTTTTRNAGAYSQPQEDKYDH